MQADTLFKYTVANESVTAFSITKSGEDEIPTININSRDLVNASVDRAEQNMFQDYLLTRSDKLCSTYLNNMYIRISSRQMSLASIAKAAGAVGTFAEAISPEMSLVQTLATGLNDTYDNQVLQNQMVYLLINKINTERDTKLSEIKKSRAKTTYTLSNSLQDVNEYHKMCSFLEGLTGLTKASTSKSD